MSRNKGLTFYKRRKRISSAVVREVFSWLFGIAAAIFIAGVGAFFFGMEINVVGVSMEDTLSNGQGVLVNRFVYLLSKPRQGDVVVFLPNGNENAHYYVKRVVACPGEQVHIADGILYVDGSESEWVTEKILDGGIAENEFTLASGEYFCIGDNANNSEDSRSANIGPVNERDMIGKVWLHFPGENDGIGFVK
ncbi:MAG: signal peptidase I [Lachnospiraceae bacterium]|nr:signal peptidase I [Lachnospiraceae bacterium]